MLISGFGRRGKAKGDIPGVRFKVVKVSGVGLLALWKEKKVRSFVFSSNVLHAPPLFEFSQRSPIHIHFTYTSLPLQFIPSRISSNHANNISQLNSTGEASIVIAWHCVAIVIPFGLCLPLPLRPTDWAPRSRHVMSYGSMYVLQHSIIHMLFRNANAIKNAISI